MTMRTTGLVILLLLAAAGCAVLILGMRTRPNPAWWSLDPNSPSARRMAAEPVPAPPMDGPIASASRR